MIGCSAPCCGRYCSALEFVVRCWQPSKALNSELLVNMNGRVGPAVSSQIGAKQG